MQNDINFDDNDDNYFFIRDILFSFFVCSAENCDHFRHPPVQLHSIYRVGVDTCPGGDRVQPVWRGGGLLFRPVPTQNPEEESVLYCEFDPALYHVVTCYVVRTVPAM